MDRAWKVNIVDTTGSHICLVARLEMVHGKMVLGIQEETSWIVPRIRNSSFYTNDQPFKYTFARYSNTKQIVLKIYI